MKMFVLDRRRPRVFRVRQPGGACLRLVRESCDEAARLGRHDMTARDVPTLAVLNENEHGSSQ